MAFGVRQSIALWLWASDSSFVNKDRNDYDNMVMRIIDTMHTDSCRALVISQSSTLLRSLHSHSSIVCWAWIGILRFMKHHFCLSNGKNSSFSACIYWTLFTHGQQCPGCYGHPVNKIDQVFQLMELTFWVHFVTPNTVDNLQWFLLLKYQVLLALPLKYVFINVLNKKTFLIKECKLTLTK